MKIKRLEPIKWFKSLYEKYQFIRFCMVGAVGAAVLLGIASLLNYLSDKHYIFHINPSLAFTIGFLCSVVVAFILNKNFTFSLKGSKRAKIMFIKYLGVTLFSLLLGRIAIKLFVDFLNINTYISFFLTAGVTTLSNFIGSKLFAFK